MVVALPLVHDENEGELSEVVEEVFSLFECSVLLTLCRNAVSGDAVACHADTAARFLIEWDDDEQPDVLQEPCAQTRLEDMTTLPVVVSLVELAVGYVSPPRAVVKARKYLADIAFTVLLELYHGPLLGMSFKRVVDSQTYKLLVYLHCFASLLFIQ